MKILITGASGLIGAAVHQHLNEQGHTVKPLIRGANASEGNQPYWDIKNGLIDFKGFEPDAVIHLAGENLVQRWTKVKKERVLGSRVNGTRLLVSHLVKMENPPKVLLSGSAIGFYGSRGDEEIDEQSSSRPSEFLSKVCIAWEAETEPARDAGIRVVLMRTGVVLTKEGGALAKMLTPFKAGIGGIIGSGEQYMSWLSMDDMVGMIDFLLRNDLEGPVNMTAPNPEKNRTFTKALGAALNRPTFFPVPACAVKTLFGSEMAKEMLLEGSCVLPKKLIDAGYEFRHKTVAEAFGAELN